MESFHDNQFIKLIQLAKNVNIDLFLLDPTKTEFNCFNFFN